MFFSAAAFPAIEQVAPISPAETIPAQDAVEQVTPTNPASWYSYNPVPQGGYLIASTPDALCSAAKVAFIASTADEYTYTFFGSMTYIPRWNAYYCFSVLTWVNGKNYYPSGSPYYASLYSAASCPVASPAYQYNDLTALCERTIPCPSATPRYTLNSGTNMCERPAVCPIPATYPEIPYLYNSAKQLCERTVPDTLTITLSGGTTTEPSTSLPFKAIVTDQAGLPADAQVSLSVDVVAYTGGHEHDANRPKGKLSRPSGNTTSGVLEFDFIAEQVAGTHTITAKCDRCDNTTTASVDVKVAGLVPLLGSPFYTLQLPNRDTNHPNAHFLLPTALSKLEMIASLYYSYTYYQSKNGVIPDFVLNDAHLKWGGVLDCFLTCANSQAWGPAHIEHQRGSVVDIKANGEPGSIVYENDFRNMAGKVGVDIGKVHGKGSGRHYHVRLNGVKE